MNHKTLNIKNAKENNLKGIDVSIPHNTFTVITGLSGSGKSSLAFDTVYAEGQRRYIETFSPYTRQFFDKIKKPHVDSIENVRPAIAIEQRTRIFSSRSTVGSLTNILDYLKILWSNIATAVCPHCNISLQNWTATTLANHLISFFNIKNDRTFLIATKISIQSKSLKAELLRFSTLGFSRIYNETDGKVYPIDDLDIKLLEKEDHIILVLDRVSKKAPNLTRLRETIDQAFSLSNGNFILIEQKDKSTRKLLRIINSPNQENISRNIDEIIEFNENYKCHYQDLSIPRIKPSLFSHNHPIGACDECKGFGRILIIDRSLCIPNPSLTIEEGAVHCWSGKASSGELKRLLKFCKEEGISSNKSWSSLSNKQREAIFTNKSKSFRGILHWFKRLEKKAYKMHVRVFLSRYRTQVACPSCHGARLKKSSLAFQVDSLTFPNILDFTIEKLFHWVNKQKEKLKTNSKLPRELKSIFDAVIARLKCLIDLGLPYLTLERQARTLSGGETQRVNLATAIGSELVSTQFVLDEPSVGLHQRDTKNLIKTLHQLKEHNNSLLVVEHDLDCIYSAENIIEMGPKAGLDGGSVVYQGKIGEWKGVNYDKAILANRTKNTSANNFINIQNASARNLKNFNLQIPLQQFICLSGVSGSGKSSLAKEVIFKAYEDFKKKLSSETNENLVTGFENLEQVLFVDQSPLSKTPRANIATYSKIWDDIRTLIANSDDARIRKLTKSSFSFNVDGGRCSNCNGAGYIVEDMQFLSDVYVVCEICLGKRFKETVLEVKYRGKSIHDILHLSIDEASRFFHGIENIRITTEILSQLGLGHLTLGHPLNALSGGESQRLKLVPILNKSNEGKSLLMFDEPTTGLHVEDVHRLIELFRDLCKQGHSILCIEHNLAVLTACDWIIDLGPEGGEAGGYIVKEGPLKDFLKQNTSKYKSYTEDALVEFTKSLDTQKVIPYKSKTPLTQRDHLIIRGAREHNLKNIDVKIPLNRMVALCGVSGSGKSSIAKDIIYAEGQRRFLDCLSPYARQFIEELKKPEIDSIENIQPTICVYQHTFQPAKLSTIATMSEVYNYLRLIYSKIGLQYCPDHPRQQVSPLSQKEISEIILAYKTPSVRILAPVIKQKKGHHNEVMNRAIESEINEIRVDGLFGPPSRFLNALDKKKVHSIDFVIGKFNPANIAIDMLEDALSLAFSLSAGTVIIHSSNSETIYSTERTCPECNRGFYKPDPEDLSFNSKRGACKTCLGTGQDDKGKRCSVCLGTRLSETSRNIKLNEFNIHELCLMNAKEIRAYLEKITLTAFQRSLIEAALNEAKSKLDTLIEIGLDYLSLDRNCNTLSSGELQRLRLATALGSPLSGVMYIFDEPSAGLHPNDNQKILNKIRSMCTQGNSVILIEHDPTSILACDYVLDIGPGGGKDGGEVVYSGNIDNFKSCKTSKTSLAIQEPVLSSFGKTSTPTQNKLDFLLIKVGEKNNVRVNNLKVPLNSLVTIAGVSGAGKSSLVHGIISETLNLGKTQDKKTFKYNENILVSNFEIEKALYIDQKPIGINSRSTPASYLGIWDQIRTVFASTIEAKTRGWGPSHFSYNTGKGRCNECKGQGQIKLEMSFLPDATVLCEACRGSRYLDETNSIHYLGISISDVLNLTFEQAKSTFAHHRKIHQAISLVCEIGLGYLSLGQASPSLSGGECQRLKLVAELYGSRKGHTVYILDEPTTGLHKLDIVKLLKILRDLVALGNSVIVIEHDESVIFNADYIIELGPGAGNEGGRVIFEGSPNHLIQEKTPWGKIAQNS